MPLEEVPRGLSAPLACQVIANIVGTEAGALSGEHQWHSNGRVSRDDIVGCRIPPSCSSSRPPVVVLMLISLATLSLILSSISLTLTCVAMTTSPWQRRTGAADGLAPHKRQTINHSENRNDEAQQRDTRTSAQLPLPSLTASGRRLGDSRSAAATGTQSVPCQCTEVSQVESESPVAAHVAGADTDAGVKSQITNWQAKDCTSSSNRILCPDGRLVAPEAGLYYVYSQLYIILRLGQEGELAEDRAYTLWHGVHRWSPADGKLAWKGVEAEPVLMQRHWTQTGSGDLIEVTSHLAGVFNLSSNDELTVHWSNSKESITVDSDRKMTYFGMFKVR